VSIERETRLPASDSYPVRFASWPRTMFTATALMNPVRTEFGMNRTSLPIRSRPRVSITSPVITERVNSALAASGPVVTTGTSAMITAIAPVAWTVMNNELVASAPATVPKR